LYPEEGFFLDFLLKGVDGKEGSFLENLAGNLLSYQDFL
jgi:hypothetical protein